MNVGGSGRLRGNELKVKVSGSEAGNDPVKKSGDVYGSVGTKSNACKPETVSIIFYYLFHFYFIFKWSVVGEFFFFFLALEFPSSFLSLCVSFLFLTF